MDNSFKELIQQFYEFIINTDFRVFICGLVLIGTYAIVLLLWYKGILTFEKNKRKMEKAIKLNHVIKAKRVSCYDDDPYRRNVNSYFHAKYEYAIDGKKFRYWYLGKIVPPYILTLYYINNPKRAFHCEKGNSPLIILIFIIPIVAMICVMKLLGIIG